MKTKLTYYQEHIVKKLTEASQPMRIASIGDPTILRGSLGSLVKKGIVTVSENGMIQLVKNTK